MIKFFLFAILGLSAALFATAANQCYVTTKNDLQAGNLNNIVIKNCNEFISDFSGKLNPARLNVPIHCFTMRVNEGRQNLRVKGCIPRGACNTAKEMVMDMIRESGLDYWNTFTCSECYGDNCNGYY